ncbi:hypothetical protein [uncultured Paludibaculum sp.]|uniref:hypothetical protein n=1 Tax=uncultured Paludibaculum sp. TaxID=1765020 RepID=UPI002AAC196D|nr:hypothetical protein [uncultured Paludibaculum sp.]
MKSRGLLLACAVLLSGPVSAQRVQNKDVSFSYGPLPIKSSTIRGTNVTANGTIGMSSATGYGYQVARTAAGSIWIDVAPIFGLYASGSASVPGRINNGFSSITAGFRLMVPLQSRTSVYGTLGGGVGSFSYPVVSGDSTQPLTSNSTAHGIFQFGGGLDFRLTRGLSLRGEVRNLVTGAGLSGSSGRHHLVPLIGIAFHF